MRARRSAVLLAHGELHGVLRLERPLRDFSEVDRRKRRVAAELLRVLDHELRAVLALDDAAIADLAAAFRIEGRPPRDERAPRAVLERRLLPRRVEREQHARAPGEIAAAIRLREAEELVLEVADAGLLERVAERAFLRADLRERVLRISRRRLRNDRLRPFFRLVAGPRR